MVYSTCLHIICYTHRKYRDRNKCSVSYQSWSVFGSPSTSHLEQNLSVDKTHGRKMQFICKWKKRDMYFHINAISAQQLHLFWLNNKYDFCACASVMCIEISVNLWIWSRLYFPMYFLPHCICRSHHQSARDALFIQPLSNHCNPAVTTGSGHPVIEETRL